MIIISTQTKHGLMLFKYRGTINMRASNEFLHIDAHQVDHTKKGQDIHVFDKFYIKDIISIRGE